jgi:hypothetical protein
MTARLYDRRVEVYPGLFAATEGFRMSRLDGAQDLVAHVSDALDQVEQWGAREGALILSDAAYARFLDLRMATRRLIQDAADNDRVQELKHEVWTCKNNLRSAMRADLGLMFDEDRPIDT